MRDLGTVISRLIDVIPADEVSQSDEWEKIKLIVAGSKVINLEIRRGNV